MTEETAVRLAVALEEIAVRLSGSGSLMAALDQIWESIDALCDLLGEAMPPEGEVGERYIRVQDIGREEGG